VEKSSFAKWELGSTQVEMSVSAVTLHCTHWFLA
jgi:hypothetical protein